MGGGLSHGQERLHYAVKVREIFIPYLCIMGTLSQIYPHWNWKSKLNTKLRLEFQLESGFKLEFQVEQLIRCESVCLRDDSWNVCSPGRYSLYMRYRGCANIQGTFQYLFHQKRKRKGVFFSSKCKRKGEHFKQKCKRKGVFLFRECITRRKFLKLSVLRANFQQFYSKNGTFWQNLQGKHAFTKKLQEKGCLFPKICKRKGTVSKTALAQPRTKTRQVPPRGLQGISQTPWESFLLAKECLTGK